jgi:hypothetical protein
LHHLQDLLAAVTDFHSRGQPVPDLYIELLSQEAAREEGSGDSGRAETQPSAISRVQRHSLERERTPVKQQEHERYEFHHVISIIFFLSLSLSFVYSFLCSFLYITYVSGSGNLCEWKL